MNNGFCRGCGRADGSPDGDHQASPPVRVNGGLCFTCHACFLHWAKDYRQPGRATRLFTVVRNTPAMAASIDRWLRVFAPTLKNKVNDFMPQLTPRR